MNGFRPVSVDTRGLTGSGIDGFRFVFRPGSASRRIKPSVSSAPAVDVSRSPPQCSNFGMKIASMILPGNAGAAG
jgi:hypothetical protein